MKKGFSILEVLVAVTILLFAFLFMLGMFPASERGISQAKNIYSANQVARSVLDNWIGKGYAWVAGQPSGAAGAVTISGLTNGAPQSTVFKWSLLHTPVIGGGVEEIDIVVTWPQSAATSYQDHVHETAWVSQ